jgi:hypothetical protein
MARKAASTDNATDTIAMAGAAEPGVPSTEEMNRAAADYLSRATGEDGEPAERPARRSSRREPDDDRRPRSRARDDDDEDDDLDDEAPERDEEDEDEEPEPRSRRRTREDDEDEEPRGRRARVQDADDDDDDREDEDAEEDDDEANDSQVLRRLKRRLGVRKASTVRRAVGEIADNVREILSEPDERSDSRGRPRDDARGSGGAPSDDGSQLISDDEMKEIEEWNPKLAKNLKGLSTRVESIRSEFKAAEMRRAVSELNGYIDKLARQYDLDGLYGRKERGSSDRQRERRKEIITEASVYQAKARARNLVVDDEEAIEHVLMTRHRRRIEESIEGRTARRIEKSVRARASRLDLVPVSGSTRRTRESGEDGGDRDALRLADQWIRTQSGGRRSRAG